MVCLSRWCVRQTPSRWCVRPDGASVRRRVATITAARCSRTSVTRRPCPTLPTLNLAVLASLNTVNLATSLLNILFSFHSFSTASLAAGLAASLASSLAHQSRRRSRRQSRRQSRWQSRRQSHRRSRRQSCGRVLLETQRALFLFFRFWHRSIAPYCRALFQIALGLAA